MNKLKVITLNFAALILSGNILSCGPKESPIMELPPATEGFIEVNGGGATFPNTVYISLRKEDLLAVGRKNWDLAFATGADFKVLINGTTGAMAYETSATDINTIGEIQAEPLRSSGELELTFTNMNSILYVDNIQNPLSDPAINAISATDKENKVYILNRGSSGTDARPWKKIRILRRDGKYLLQHADINETSFTTIEITKNTNLNLVYFSFEDEVVTVEPEKVNWDIAWTAGTSSTPFPNAVNGTLAYFFQDLVYHNIYGGASATQVLEADIAYADFKEADLLGLSFVSDNRMAIGSSWRSGGGPTSAPGVRTDLYYILKDVNGNYYKVRFLSLTKDGERGRPSFEFKLIKEIS